VKLLESRLLEHLGEACLLSGRFDRALAFADQALDLARRRGERGHEAWALRLHGEIRSLGEPSSDLSGTEEHYRLALDLAHRLGMRPLSAHCHFGLGALYRRAERPEAETHLRSAIAIYRDIDMRAWVEKVRAAATGRAESGMHGGSMTPPHGGSAP
jgi:tetratricopeptide (TPR) repeat protein